MLIQNRRSIWSGVALPRAELVTWFIIQKRLNTRDRLCSLNIIPENQTACLLCNEVIEAVSHLFFECKISWKLWSECFLWWNMCWVFHNQPCVFFEDWMGVPFYDFEKKLWRSMLYVVLWSIWEYRNHIVFENFSRDWNLEVLNIKLRVGCWARGWSYNFPYSLDMLVYNLQEVHKWRSEPRTRLFQR